MNTGLLAERLQMDAMPGDLVKAAEWVTNKLLADIVRGRIEKPTLVVLGRRASRWELGTAETDLGDLLRSICRHEAAHVAALAHHQPLPPEVEGASSGWLITVEDALNRMDVLVAMKGDEEGSPFRVFTKPPISMMPRWIGRDPTLEVDLTAALAGLQLSATGDA